MAAIAGEKGRHREAGVPGGELAPGAPRPWRLSRPWPREPRLRAGRTDFADLNVEALAGAALRRFSWKGRPFETRLLGSYQPFNAALALTAADVLCGRGWAISDEAAASGIASARWPGRFEVVGTSPLTIVDGGHNPQGAEALAASLADLLGGEGCASSLLFGRARRQGLSGHGARRDAVGPQLLGVRPEKPSRPGGRRAGGLRAQSTGGGGPGR